MSATTYKRGATAGLALALALGISLPTAAFAAETPTIKDDPVVLDYGHIDAFNLVAGADESIQLALKEDVTGSHVLRTPESVELFVKASALTEVPAGYLPDMPASIYHLPLTQNHDLIWPGWDTNAITAVYGNGNTEFNVSVDGPGDVFLWSQNSFGQPKSLMLEDKYQFPGVISQPYAAHTHANWAFTAPGTYKLTVTGNITSADQSKTTTTNTGVYTFVVGERTKLTPEVPTQEGNTVTIPSQDWVTYVDGEGNPLEPGEIDVAEGLTVRAVLSTGFELADGATAEWTFDSQPVAPQIAITGVADHYHQYTTIVLTAEATPAVENGRYEWFVQRKDQDAPVKVDGATGSELRIMAEQALNGAKITANLVDDSGVVASAPAVTVEVNDHGAGPLQKVAITGLKDHYHNGDSVTLKAEVEPESVLTRYEWYIQKTGDAAPVLVPEINGPEYTFEATPELAGAKVSAHLTYNNSEAYVQSPAVIVQVEDHEVPIPDTTLSIATDRAADDYWVGQTVTLTATQEPETGLTDYRWYTKQPGSEDFALVEGATTGEYKFKPTLENSGIQVKVELLNKGEVHAESAPVTITTGKRDVVTTLKVTADKESYVAGETAHLTSEQQPATDHAHYHWYVKRAGDDAFTWVQDSRAADLDYPVTDADNGAQLVLRLFDDTHAVISESEPVTLAVTPGEEPVPGTLSLEGLKDSYKVGETLSLQAKQADGSIEGHYHWFIKRAGDADFAVIPEAHSGALEYELTDKDDKAQIVAKLYGEDHTVIAESSAAVLSVSAADQPGGGDNPGNGGDTPDGDKPGNGDTPGANAPQSGQGQQSGDVKKSEGSLAVTGADALPLLLAAAVLVTAGGVGITARRKHLKAEQD